MGSFKQGLRATTIATAAMALTVAGTAGAQTWTISTAVTTTQYLSGNEHVVVTSSGSITVTGNGIFALGGDNTVDVQGSIDAENIGIYALGGDNTVDVQGSIDAEIHGISASGDDNTITVQGSIDAEIHGIRASGDDNTITVQGSIDAGIHGIRAGLANGTIDVQGSIDAGADGISASGDDNTITVQGSIDAGKHGIFAFGGMNTINVQGSIDVGQHGIYAVGDSNTIDVQGSIDAGQNGIFADGDSNTIDVQGSIDAGQIGICVVGDSNTIDVQGSIDAGIRGIFAVGDSNSVSVSGTVIAFDEAIFFTGTNNTLNLRTGTFLEGGLEQLGSGTILTLDTEGWHDVRWDFDHADMASITFQGGGLYTYDPATGIYQTYNSASIPGMIDAGLSLFSDVDVLTQDEDFAAFGDISASDSVQELTLAFSADFGDGDAQVALRQSEFETGASALNLMLGYSLPIDEQFHVRGGLSGLMGETAGNRWVNDNTVMGGIANLSANASSAMAVHVEGSYTSPVWNLGGFAISGQADVGLTHVVKGMIDEGASGLNLDMGGTTFAHLDLGGSASFGPIDLGAGVRVRELVDGDPMAGLITSIDAFNELTPYVSIDATFGGFDVSLGAEISDDPTVSLSGTYQF